MKIIRFKKNEECIIGKLEYKGLVLYTLELPYRNNQKNVSSIKRDCMK